MQLANCRCRPRREAIHPHVRRIRDLVVDHLMGSQEAGGGLVRVVARQSSAAPPRADDALLALPLHQSSNFDQGSQPYERDRLGR
jgi:hypothetical protein